MLREIGDFSNYELNVGLKSRHWYRFIVLPWNLYIGYSFWYRHTSLNENKYEMPFWICIVCITPRLQRNWRVHPLFLFLKVPIIRSKLFTVVFIVTYLALLPSFTAINWCPNDYPTVRWAWIKVTFSGILLCVRHCLNSFVLFQFVLYKIKSLCYGIIPSALQCCVRVCN